jgi:hypothetical protein
MALQQVNEGRQHKVGGGDVKYQAWHGFEP